MQPSIEEVENLAKQPLMSDPATEERFLAGLRTVIENPDQTQPPTIIPLDDVTLPSLPVEVFPDALGHMIDAVAKSTETPVELAALISIGTLATSCQKVFEVSPEPGYREPLCLWTVAAL